MSEKSRENAKECGFSPTASNRFETTREAMSSAPQTSSIKQGQIAHLSKQLKVLQERTETTEKLIITTAEQASYIKLLGGYHAAWYGLVAARFERDGAMLTRLLNSTGLWRAARS